VNRWHLLRSGQAHLAAIDCVTLAGVQRDQPDWLLGLRVIGETPSAPGLPLITARGTQPDELDAVRRALKAACADPAFADVRLALFIAGFEAAHAAAWQRIEEMRRAGAGLHDFVASSQA
jgi:ABC-type phosphate/phosphonate transport system substrate-binding protein